MQALPPPGALRAGWRRDSVRRRAAVADVDGAPEVPTGHGAVGRPADAAGGDVARRGQLALAEHRGEALADAVVVDRQHVGAAEPEDEQHLRGPAADAAHG